jgi:lipopolysaccharide/colanic/teichoic acid biosynthesis glycosyltransferase
MSLVGPRPEVPKYVEFYPKRLRTIIFSVLPGITDFASIEYKNENAFLSKADDPHSIYINEVMPAKLRYYEQYVVGRCLRVDIKLLLRTIKVLYESLLNHEK